MTIFKKIIFILAIICFSTGAFWLYASADTIFLIKTTLTRGSGGGENGGSNLLVELKDQDEDWNPVKITETWMIEGAMPGQMSPWQDFCKWIRIRNSGNREANRLKISLENTCQEVGYEESDTKPDSAEGMDKYIEIVQFRYGEPGFFGQLFGRNLKEELEDNGDNNGNGFADLDDFENYNNGDGFIDLDPPCLNDKFCRIKQISICIRLHPSTPNDYQGDRVESDLTFELTSNNNSDF